MTTVCSKLFCICEPDRAYFGRRTTSSLVVARMVQDLNLGLEITGAWSRRSPEPATRLLPEERDLAFSLWRLLAAQGVPRWRARRQRAWAAAAPVSLGAAGEPDYLELVDAETLSPSRPRTASACPNRGALPSARLIDNAISALLTGDVVG